MFLEVSVDRFGMEVAFTLHAIHPTERVDAPVTLKVTQKRESLEGR